MTYAEIDLTVERGVALLTLNRPDKLNAYTAVMGQELEDAFLRADRDDDIRVVVVTGAGRAFCAGADISGGSESFSDDRNFGARGEGKTGGFVMAIHHCRKPSIAAINGAAVGVGITMTLPMDIRIASSAAKMGFVFIRRGLVPEAGSAWFLPRIVGLPQALRWCYSARVFDAQEALRGGLVSEVHATEALLDAAMTCAREIAEGTAPVATAITRTLLWEASQTETPWGALAHDGVLNRVLGASPDVREGVAAFLEKRAPNFGMKVSSDMPELARALYARREASGP